jgi:biopolymer transport protein ExbB
MRGIAALLLLLLPVLAHAWWNEDWAYRKKITLNTSASGADSKEAVSDVPVLVRLHTGNFTFLDAREDGSDVRFVAADDKTPLKYHIEQWDPVTELAQIWIHIPRLSPRGLTTPRARTTPRPPWCCTSRELRRS